MDSATMLFAFLALIGFGSGAICDKLALRGLSANTAVIARSLMTAVIFAGYGALAETEDTLLPALSTITYRRCA